MSGPTALLLEGPQRPYEFVTESAGESEEPLFHGYTWRHESDAPEEETEAIRADEQLYGELMERLQDMNNVISFDEAVRRTRP